MTIVKGTSASIRYFRFPSGKVAEFCTDLYKTPVQRLKAMSLEDQRSTLQKSLRDELPRGPEFEQLDFLHSPDGVVERACGFQLVSAGPARLSINSELLQHLSVDQGGVGDEASVFTNGSALPDIVVSLVDPYGAKVS